jgi:formylmethanofuran dehydrogenase subunit E
MEHEARQERYLERLPICSECGEPITDDECYEIGDELFCEECIEGKKVYTSNYVRGEEY